MICFGILGGSSTRGGRSKKLLRGNDWPNHSLQSTTNNTTGNNSLARDSTKETYEGPSPGIGGGSTT